MICPYPVDAHWSAQLTEYVNGRLASRISPPLVSYTTRDMMLPRAAGNSTFLLQWRKIIRAQLAGIVSCWGLSASSGLTPAAGSQDRLRIVR
jgi:hypothetical protein